MASKEQESLDKKSKMEFVLDSLSMHGARLGRLVCPTSSSSLFLDTPGCLIHTRGGATPNLTRDLEEQLLAQFQPSHETGDRLNSFGFMITMPTLYMT